MFQNILIYVFLIFLVNPSYSFTTNSALAKRFLPYKQFLIQNNAPYCNKIVSSRLKPLKDILGLGAPEIALGLVVALVLFGPETLKSLSKDVGRAAAELKEIPKTFKEGMDEGAQSAEVSKMKAIAAEKRKKRDEKLASATEENVDDE